ncbi:inorganic diphosphatase [Deinococcus metallilatus]|uniref:inorganic diphosphatase n=1 Tax=Deinococcus metallilatus TaxID=1211322 RepID=A0AAJ5F4G1_9DEIO|nr:inorganic diphosphatase [Deinococcus metallilatus]MBB5297404.1 inorganic pyrophosphatase [Deinococcus metallilatus]QBY08779.1 inorganic diphosphatase [Deinococcus metallilatus]RXJ10660.1 inorganic diphosphatase [Deinococcus metallilatus]TLK26630.1 inorganic diphosphatase [Deinococcus metallilatus]GMA17054.1 inorganic pyrophosphatase [Deinococcus metallilatus]
MSDLTRLPHRLDPAKQSCRAIIETPKGRRSKFDYDPESGLFELGGLLAEGMTFPLDFGFVPSTLGGDGDPLDVLVLTDEPTFPGCLLTVRLLGVIEAEQTEEGKTERNDRLLALAESSFLYEKVRDVEGLPGRVVEQLQQFFVNYNAAKGKQFKVLAVRGPERAAELVQEGSEALRRKQAGQ